MITLKEAYKKAQAQCCWLIGKAFDCGDFWEFTPGKLLIISATIGVYKATGEVFRVYPPDMTDEQVDALEHAKEVPIPT